MSSSDGIRQGIYQSGIVRRLARWLDAIPHPVVACEIAADYVAAARWSRTGTGLDGYAVEPLASGAIVPIAGRNQCGGHVGSARSRGPRVLAIARQK